jgi:hypothetical protein
VNDDGHFAPQRGATRRAALAGTVVGLASLVSIKVYGRNDGRAAIKDARPSDSPLFKDDAIWIWHEAASVAEASGATVVRSGDPSAGPGAWVRYAMAGRAAVSFGTVKALLADQTMDHARIPAGTRVQAGSTHYLVAPAGAYHAVRTTGGLGLYPAETVIRPEQFGIVDEGDASRVLQAAFDFGGRRAPVHLSRVYHVHPGSGPKSLRVPSHSRLVFEAGSRIENLPHRLTGYEMLLLHNVRDVEIVDAMLDGRRDLNLETGGEWGNGIQILGDVDDIRIIAPVTNNMWGDGIYIGEDMATGANPRSVEVTDPRADNCRRQGMSITSAHRCIVRRPVWTNTHGTPPSAGLDIEPNLDSCVLQDIQIIAPETRGNAGAGIAVYLGVMRSGSSPVNISITDHVSDGDNGGGQFARTGTAGSYVKGHITYIDPVIRNSRASGIGVEDWDIRGASISIVRPSIEFPNRGDLTADRARAGITLFLAADGDAETIGNVNIMNPSIIGDPGGAIERYIYIQNEKTPDAVANIIVTDPVKLQGAKYSWIEGRVSWHDKDHVSQYVHVDADRERVIDKWHFSGYYTNRGANDVVSFRLSDEHVPVGWPDVTIAAEGNFPVRVCPSGRDRISNVSGDCFQIQPGMQIVVRRVAPLRWQLVTWRCQTECTGR